MLSAWHMWLRHSAFDPCRGSKALGNTDELDKAKKKGLRGGLLVCCISRRELKAFANRKYDGFTTADVVVWENQRDT